MQKKREKIMECFDYVMPLQLCAINALHQLVAFGDHSNLSQLAYNAPLNKDFQIKPLQMPILPSKSQKLLWLNFLYGLT